MDTSPVIEEIFRALAGRLDEATLRLWAAVEARALGRGGVSAVARIGAVGWGEAYSRTPTTPAQNFVVLLYLPMPICTQVGTNSQAAKTSINSLRHTGSGADSPFSCKTSR
jgi:hypothetical protein